MCWNVWSMLSEEKCSNVLQVLMDNDIQVACISETWFDSKNGTFTNSIKTLGFELIHGYREDQRGGGTAILYKNTLKVKPGEASSTKYTSFEFSYLTLNNSASKILLGCIYRKKEQPCSLFVDELETFIDEIFQKGDTIIIVGDFNVWVDVQEDKEAIMLLNLMNGYGLTQLIHESTHRGGHTLDHVYVNQCQVSINCEVISDSLGVSDHYPIIFKVPITEQAQLQQTITYRNCKNIDTASLLSDFKDVFHEIEHSAGLDFKNNYDLYDTLTRKVVDKHAPLVTKSIKRNEEPPWMDADFKQNRAKRRKLEKKWKRNSTEENREAYIIQRRLCAELCKNKRTEYYSKIVENAGNDQKTLFKIANELLDKNKTRSLPEHEDPVKLANEFNKYYIDKIDNLRKTIPFAENVITPKLYEGSILESFQPTNEEELEEIIKEFGIKTSSEDPIPSNILKMICNEALPTLVMLVNQSLSTGCMDGVKLSIIDPLLKKCGLDCDIKKHYRPVNNLLFFSKLIERIVLKRINTHMGNNSLNNDNAFAYKKFHNTETMMLGLVNEVLQGFDENKCTIILFLDLSAAFDTIDIEKLLGILHEELGIRGLALSWVRSFLTGRTQKVRINGEFSDSMDVKYGAPQGSVLGPKFFSIYVRAQPEVFQKCKFVSSAFADDSNGRKTFSITLQYNILKNEVPKCLEEVTKWMNYQFLKVNPDKTELLLLYPKSLENKVIIKGTMINEKQCIRFSDVVKNVGVWLDKHLELTNHTNKIVSHCYKILKDIGRIRSVLSRDHTEILVHSVITSRLDYCNSLFFNMNKSNLDKLQKVQNAAARLVVKKRKTQSISEDIKKLHWLRVESRIIFKILLLVYKSTRGTCSKNLELEYKQYNCRPDDFLKLQLTFAKTKYGERRYEYFAPRLWNALPLHIRTEEKIEEFKKKLKTLLFQNTEVFKAKALQYK